VPYITHTFEGNFLSVPNVKSDRFNKNYISINIYLSGKQEQMQRLTLNLITAFGQVGGIQGLLMSFFGIIVGYFSERLFKISMLKHLFLV